MSGDSLTTVDAPANRTAGSTGRPPDADLPLAAWLEPALALPLIEIALDVTIRTPVSVNSPACAG